MRKDEARLANDRDVAGLIPLAPRKQIANRDRSGYGQFVLLTAAAGAATVVPHDLARIPQIVLVCDAGVNAQPRLTVSARSSTSITVAGDVATVNAILYLC